MTYYGYTKDVPGVAGPIPAITAADRDLLDPILGGDYMRGLAARDQATWKEVGVLIVRVYNAGKHGHQPAPEVPCD